ncbi:hypothetical protein BJX63DRAFT_396607 [Aspergillus granulosus]|uniref:Uncharacterized protein n=1 Tax=Aspergillus granulosus TaxID=176169 RepID=A0ABR4HAP4_9EURO
MSIGSSCAGQSLVLVVLYHVCSCSRQERPLVPRKRWTTLLASHGHIYGPGGQGVIEDKQYGLALYYHFADKLIGLSRFQYQLGWNRLGWNEEWPVRRTVFAARQSTSAMGSGHNI